VLLFEQNRRWQLALVLMATFFVGYLDRYNITFALPLMAQEFGWSESDTQDYGSLLMGAFFAAYGLANLLLTPVASRFGARRSLVIMVCLWTVFTAMGAWVSQWMILLVITRVLLGISEGVHVPMMTQLTKVWFPLEERARANSIFVAGLFLAVFVAPLVLVPLMGWVGWRWGFVLVAFAGLLLSLPLVLLFVHNTPRQHPLITPVELAHIEAGRAREEQQENAGLTWRELVAMPRFVLLVIIGIINNVVTLGVSSWLPTYFTNNRGLAFSEITFYVATPYVFSIAGIACWAFLGDRINARSALGACGFAGAAVLMFFALSADALWVVLLCFSAGVFMAAAYNACEFAMVQKIVPVERTAQAVGIYNGLATMIGGGLGPLIVSPIIGAQGPFWLISVIAGVNAILLVVAWRLIRY
jgi:MFS family permease